ncbi:hypothetical protein ABT336_14670 [Micromonospora sp. NPDC000207]|uniref:hypothetical protein n=1 Tax=Micromonospora sp. NPDC000207 TaxID=3154246 RepID=UPI0033261973
MLAGLTGRSAPTEGAVGVRLNADGRLVGVFDWCRGKAGADMIALCLSDDLGGVTDEVTQLRWEPGLSSPTTEEVVLLGLAADWQTEQAPPTLNDSQVHNLRAWNEDEGAVQSFPFRISELRGRTGPDVILTKQWEGDGSEHGGGYVATFHTPEGFARHADKVCDD